MNGLLYKDLLNLSSTMKYLAFMALIFCVIFLPMGNELPVYILLVMFCAMLPTTAISLDTAARWDKYAVSLPVTRKGIVRVRYELMLLGIFAAGIISLMITAAMAFLMPGKGIFLQFVSPLMLTVMFVAFGLMLGSVALPLTLKFGAEKMRYITMLIALTPVLVIFGMVFLVDMSGVPTFSPVLLGGVIAGAAVVVGVSYLISVRIYTKKEF